MVFFPSALSLALLLAPFFPPSGGKKEFAFWYGTYAIVGVATVGIAVLWWLVWIKVLPRWGGYTYEEECDELEDGTRVTKLVKVKNKEYEKR